MKIAEVKNGYLVNMLGEQIDREVLENSKVVKILVRKAEKLEKDLEAAAREIDVKHIETEIAIIKSEIAIQLRNGGM